MVTKKSSKKAASKAKPSVKATIDWDSPVSNQIAETESTALTVAQPVSEPPANGANYKKPKVTANGMESVKGHDPETAGAEAESAEVRADEWKPPVSDTLRDIGEASFGGPPPSEEESVIGPDDRVRITKTGDYPWRVHASLLMTAADNSMWIGTGWFIGPHTLITAGHCVYIKGSDVPGRDGWVKKINVMPGRNGAKLPYGQVISTKFFSTLGWTQNGDRNYDYAAIIIPTDLGKKVGWFGFGIYPDNDLQATTGNIAGYPSDKDKGTLRYDAKKIASVDARRVYYEIDTVGGQSGSAVYRIINNERYAVAIHAYGVGATRTNSGARIVKPVYDNLVAWKA